VRGQEQRFAANCTKGLERAKMAERAGKILRRCREVLRQ
jgi:hypothetical protein